jgi:hypothetical protein
MGNSQAKQEEAVSSSIDSTEVLCSNIQEILGKEKTSGEEEQALFDCLSVWTERLLEEIPKPKERALVQPLQEKIDSFSPKLQAIAHQCIALLYRHDGNLEEYVAYQHIPLALCSREQDFARIRSLAESVR